MTDDRALVSQIIGGDMQAFRRLIKLHERLVAHMVARLVDQAEDREELCQDVFLKVYEKIREFNFQSRLSTWIATIAYRHAINHLRKRKVEVQDIHDNENYEEQFVSEGNPEEEMAEKDMDGMVLKFIDQLPAQYRIILTLYHVDGLSYQEISETMSTPEGTVKNYLFRARQLLKEKVMRYLGKEEWK